ncbi:ATP-binding protein [candidate division KSB1 bacterium]|nr:MAG: ATP-binding protein [candidate division KSB1 bacterium]
MDIKLDVNSKPNEQDQKIQKNLDLIKNRIVVFSGKGGVGKTTVAVNLSFALLRQGSSVGLLDADITGPNVPKMVGLNDMPGIDEKSKQIIPQIKDGLQVISIAPMIPADAPIIWRGPLRSGAITQFLSDVVWGQLDFLLADLPPGTGDEVLTTAQKMLPQMAIVVTTPQEVSLIDCRRAVNMAKKLQIKKIAVVENMSGLICPHCGKTIDLFGSGGGEKMAQEMGVAFLGKIPMEVSTRKSGDEGKPVVIENPESETGKAFLEIAKNTVSYLNQ